MQVQVYIEIEKGSNQKYEFNHDTHTLELDRVLPEPYVYPFPYGFITNTKASDGDELDALILTDTPLRNDATYDVWIVGVLVMEVEQGMDEKILCAFEDREMESVDMFARFSIEDFFTNYKKTEKEKWSRVDGFKDKNSAVRIYKKSLLSNYENKENKE